MEKLVLTFQNFVLTLALSALAFTGCAKKDDAPKGIDAFTRVAGSAKEESTNRIEGTLTIRFLTTQATIIGSQSLKVSASLPANGGSVTLIAYGANVLLTDGVQLRLTRDGARVTATIKVNGEPARQILQTSSMLQWDPEDLRITADFHNEQNATHVYVWNHETPRKELGSAAFNSDATSQLDQPMPTVGGLGVFSGLRLENAVVTAATNEASQLTR